MFDEFEVQGNTIPQAEVELYLNNALIDFAQADELGNYRFLTPITYGSSQLDLRIFGPTGQVIERSNRIQIPFTFQPKGIFNYTLNAGQLDNALLGSTSQNYTVQGHGAYGITEWLTAEAGVEYYEGVHNNLPTFTSSLSSRILNNYVLTAEYASEAYYRGVLNAIYPNSASINVDYTDFTSGLGIYNPSNDDKRIIASAFYPFQFWDVPFNIRASTFSRFRPSTSSTTFRVDGNTRLGKFNLRLGYSDRFSDTFDPFNPTTTANFESSVTYNISRNRNIPSYLRGVFLRAQMRYQPALKEVESAELLFSRNIFTQGRVQVSFGHNFSGGYNTLRFSFVVDFDKVRSSSTFNNIRGNSNFTQNIRGSIGYDTNYDNFIFTSRNQVGRSGAAVQLFVDNNSDGIYNEGDDAISENAIRVQRSGAQTIEKNGVLYLTQMNSYFHYNMEMNKSAIKNPMLVPEVEKFGMITDPNRFKKVEVPFYMSGIVEGTVKQRRENGANTGIGGLKLTLSDSNGDFAKELRTFSDGSFYEWEVPPGNYELKVDAGNLQQLKVKSIPEKLEFEVEALPDGDFVEGLSLLLVPEDYVEPEEEPELVTIPEDIKTDDEMLAFESELNNSIDDVLRLIIQAQQAFYNKDINKAMNLVDQSLDIFETAQAFALKGSLCYMKNDKESARNYWERAKKLDPDIYIPDERSLDQIIVPEPINSPQ
jgi:tetratricopeptide (TPR) repeat protein